MRSIEYVLLGLLMAPLLSTMGCGGPDCAASAYGTCVRDSEHHGAHELAFLSWLEGNWQARDSAGRVHDERWSPATGGVMIGVAHSYHEDRDLGGEVMRIEVRRESITYTAHLGGEVPGTSFALNDVGLAGRGEARFENPEHDFPTRIIYHRSGDDELLVRVENDERGFTRLYRRVSREATHGGAEPETETEAAAATDSATDSATEVGAEE